MGIKSFFNSFYYRFYSKHLIETWSCPNCDFEAQIEMEGNFRFTAIALVSDNHRQNHWMNA